MSGKANGDPLSGTRTIGTERDTAAANAGRAWYYGKAQPLNICSKAY